MVSFESVIVPLSTALGLSLTVERILEFSKNLFDRIIGAKGTRKIPKLSESDEKIEELGKFYEKAKKQEEEEWEERFPPNKILVENATDPDDGKTLKAFILQLLGIAAGILLARIFKVQLFTTLLGPGGSILPATDYILTGVLIGGGSGPIHVLIRFISERKMTAGAKAQTDIEGEALPEKEMPSSPAIVTKPSPVKAEEQLDIPYHGGVDRDILEDVHVRKKNPEKVVYHHTAMSSNSTFEDVVRVIKDRGWVTGYNCVVLADGSIRPFCRWDRFGNHAKGHNMISLGIAFNGNYETDPKVPFSNPDGRLGPPIPTELQLKAAARVVTLWTFLYDDIEVDFTNKIIPHSDISQKTCPGSQFPKDEFTKWIEFYQNVWGKSTTAQEQIEAFKNKQYLYV